MRLIIIIIADVNLALEALKRPKSDIIRMRWTPHSPAARTLSPHHLGETISERFQVIGVVDELLASGRPGLARSLLEQLDRFGVPGTVAVVTGVMTATFGGILRDLLAAEPSVLLRPEIYVTAALTGAAAGAALGGFLGFSSVAAS